MCKGFGYKKQFFGIRRASNEVYGFSFADGYLSCSLPRELEDEDLDSSFSDIRDKNLVANDKPTTDPGIAFRNDINPLRFRLLFQPEFNYATIWCIAVRDGQDSIGQEVGAKLVVDIF